MQVREAHKWGFALSEENYISQISEKKKLNFTVPLVD
jgi:hypothetical protein